MATNKVHPEHQGIEVEKSGFIAPAYPKDEMPSSSSHRDLYTPSGLSTADDETNVASSDLRNFSETLTDFFVPNKIKHSRGAKRRQLVKLVVLQLIPVLILLGENIYVLINTLGDVASHNLIMAETGLNIAFGLLIQCLQRERGSATFYVATVLQQWETQVANATQQLESAEIATNNSLLDVAQAAKTVLYLQLDIDYVWNTLNNHRLQRSISPNATTAFEESAFYTDLISTILDSLPTYADVPDVDNAWRMLVAYFYLLYSKENAGRVLATGIAFFGTGSFNQTQLMLFESYYSRAIAYLTTSTTYAIGLQSTYAQVLNAGNYDELYLLGDVIRNNNLSGPDMNLTSLWAASTGAVNDELWTLQQAVGSVISMQANAAAVSLLLISLLLLVVGALVGGLLVCVAATISNKTFDVAASIQLQAEKTELEKKRTETLVLQILPRSVARKLMQGKHVQPEVYEQVSMFFSDVVEFTVISSHSSPTDVVNLLNLMFDTFDAVVDRYDVYKVETIGDAYVACSGAPKRNGSKHYSQIAMMALDIRDQVHTHLIVPHSEGEKIQVRIGLHSGPVCSGVVGMKMPRYCLFGETVSIANKMESSGQPMRIHVSQTTYLGLTASEEDENWTDKFEFEEAEVVTIDGKGDISTYWLSRPANTILSKH